MQTKRQGQQIGKSRPLPVWGLLVFAALLLIGGTAWAQELSVLSSFPANTTGSVASAPNASLVEDSSGNFYGTTSLGGTALEGTVYKIAPDGTITVLHNFGAGTVVTSGGTTNTGNTIGGITLNPGNSGTIAPGTTVTDGTNPTGNLILASDGYLYGVTSSGGPGGYGTVYKLSTAGDYSILHCFTDLSGGAYPMAGVTQGSDGNLYGTTWQGGDSSLGVVFQLKPDGTYSVVHDFDTGGDAANPYTALVRDAQGNLYGTTVKGGTAAYGTVYMISAQGIYSVIYNFAAPSYTFTLATSYSASTLGGYSPNSPLAVGANGNLYGTASGSTYGSGAAYEVTPQGQFTILHYFGDGSVANDGGEILVAPSNSVSPPINPTVADRLVAGTDGNFYGVTYAGGSTGKGTVFQMTPTGQVTIVHSFGDGTISNDGAQPAGLIQGTDGNFYGATSAGGATSGGTVFKVTSALPMFTSPLQVTAAEGTSFSYHMVATQGPDTYTVSGLPTGFTFDGTSAISATPAQTGTFTVMLTATNAVGSTTVPLTITVLSPPVITSLLDVVGSTTSLGYNILATQSPTSYSATGLPPGISVDPIGGSFIGVPTTTGTYQVTVSATNAVGTGTAVVNVTVLSTAPTAAQEYMQIHSFQDSSVAGEGSFPGQMILGKDTTLFGVTAQGGAYGDGTIFDLSPAGTASVVATFNGTNGAQPMGVIQTADGTLWGTTQSGGGTANAGTIFKVAPGGAITVLHTFGAGAVNNAAGKATTDGANPQAGLVLASDGNFYGTTQNGGSANAGTVFQMTPAGVVTILHSFGDGTVSSDGAQPVAALVQDPNLSLSGAGTITLVGTTLLGGANGIASGAPGDGTLFAISNTGSFQIFHSFGDSTVSGDGQMPRGSLTVQQLTIYGTTSAGGSIQKGTLFAYQFAGSKMTILHNFGDGTVANDGENPNSALVIGTLSGSAIISSNEPTFYGTTQNGGSAGSGTVYSCAVSVTGLGATTTIVHNNGDTAFTNDGTTPLGGICIGADGNLYGTTIGGGAGSGTMYGIEINQGNPFQLLVPTPFTCTGTIPAGMTFNSTTGTLSGTPLLSDATGVYSLTITPHVLGGTTQTVSIKLNQTYTSWTTALTAAASAGSSGSDNVAGVLKYLVGVDPSQPMTPSDYAALPAVGTDSTSQPGNTFLTLTYRQAAGEIGVGVVLESSTDLVHWSPVTGNNLLSQPIGTDSSGNTTMEMGALMTGAPQQFVRLQVTPPSL